MFTLIKQFKREFVYGSYIFLTLELLVTRQFTVTPLLYGLTSLLGLLLIYSWFVTTLKAFGRKKVSKKSATLMYVNLKSRLFSYVIMPVTLWLSLALFLFFNENAYISQIIITISVVIYFLLMLRIRSSLEKLYFVDSMTRFVYDFINIFIFYMLVSVLNRVGLDDRIMVLMVFLFTILSLHHMLYAHRKMELESTLIAILFSLAVTLVTWYTRGLNIYMQPALVTSAYYLIISTWNVRFSGARKLEDYIPSIMYTLMAIILILSL
ncbi:hypothetical protein HYV12_03705 [Candidatus Dojkabacteria bacterium]|nr:hypothetical protein [Candidatus Dojkabacteria bacterium]